MKKKRTVYDLIAALAFVFDVNWEEEYETSDAEDYFWDTEPRLKLDCREPEIILPERDAG